MNIGIVGLGLIGGSLAKSIKLYTSHHVAGIDLDDEIMLLAKLCGAIDEPLCDEKLGKCDLVLTAIRPETTVGWVKSHGKLMSKSAILVDMCGVKRMVCATLAPLSREFGFSYIGGHPMAGREKGGFVNSSGELFSGASMILTPDDRTSIEMLEMLKNFFRDIGFADLTFTTPDEHDRIIAYTSQLAHITSSAYIKSPDAQKRRGFSAGSFRDMTRVARLDSDMWTELFLDNADYLSEQLEILIGNLSDYLDVINKKDEVRLRQLLQAGCDMKSSAGGN